MIIPRVAFRYAEAIQGSLPDGEARDRAFEDFADIAETGRQSVEFRRFLKSPVIEKEKKRAVLTDLFSSRVSPPVLAALLFLVEKQREDILLPVIEALHRARRQELGIQDVRVTSVVPLTEAQEVRLRDALGTATGTQVALEKETREDILGGLVIRIDDTVYDGSVARQLHLLRERFVESVE